MSRNRLLYLWKSRRWFGLAVALASTCVQARREMNPALRRVQRLALRDFLTGRFGYSEDVA
jgi:hypothetical protein